MSLAQYYANGIECYMIGIYTSRNHLLVKGPNQSFGNHVLHLYAIYSFAKANNLPFFVTVDSNLDELFDLSHFKTDFQPSDCLFNEAYGGGLDEYRQKEIRNYARTDSILSGKELITEPVFASGWFWNKALLPSEDFFNTVRIKPEVFSRIRSKSYIFDEHTLVIHYRGTDFRHHQIGFGDIRLRQEYYSKCIEHFKQKRHSYGIIRIVLIADDVNEALSVMPSLHQYDLIVETNDYITDWMILFSCANLVCSNSSFCYTAGAYNKSIVYQPVGFFNRYIDPLLDFPIDPYYKTSIIL